MVVLFRPVGREELELIEASGFCEFPPRLVHQPVFYPVVAEEYAHEIAKRWNAEHPTSSGVGFVTRFYVRASYLAKYPIHTVGGRSHQEYWIPANELAEFNRHILGPIEVIARYDRASKP
jgi:hypothetical protein